VLIVSDMQQRNISSSRPASALLRAFGAADNPLDREFVVELERIAERTRDELEQFRQTD
jgi:hypothetical protein